MKAFLGDEPGSEDITAGPMNRIPTGTISHHAAQQRRATAILAAVDKKQPFSATDQEKVARNTHLLLEEMGQNWPVTKRQVAVAAGLGGGMETDSTKRLETYTMPNGASDARRKRLAKKPGKYIEIAKAVAKQVKQPAGPFICQVFEGCTFGADRVFLDAWEEEKWQGLANSLDLMGRAVAHTKAIGEYWSEIVRRNGSYDYHADQLLTAHRPIDADGCTTGLSGYCAHPSDMPPVPSVLLAYLPLTGPTSALLGSQSRSVISVFAAVVLEIRLALAPINRSGKPGPLFEFRSSLTVTNPDTGQIIVQNAHFEETGDGCKIAGALLANWPDPHAMITGLELPEPHFRYGSGHACRSWEEINAGLVRDLFGDWERPLELPSGTTSVSPAYQVQSHFEADTAAHELYCKLVTGTLEEALGEECRCRIEQLEQFCAQNDEQILRASADASDRWRKMLQG